MVIRGRSSPFKGYSSSGPREVSFSISLCQDYCKEGLLKTVNRLSALTYPHNESYVKPPKCKIVIGKFINITGVITAVGVEWRKPYKEGIYSFADVSISASEVVDKSQSDNEIEALNE